MYLHFDFALFSLSGGVTLTCFHLNFYLFGKQYLRQNSRCFQPVRSLQLQLAAAVPIDVCKAIIW